MMDTAELDALLAADVASGRMAAEDAEAIQVFRLYLSESPSRDADRLLWQRRWLAYEVGIHPEGPTTMEEYRELLPTLRARQREVRAARAAREAAAEQRAAMAG
jgi:hypothetical protein